MPDPSKAEYVVGVDLGGTKILAGIFNTSYDSIGTAKVSTKAQRGVEPVIGRIERCIRDAVDEADFRRWHRRAGGRGFRLGHGYFRAEPRRLERCRAEEGSRETTGRSGLCG